MIEKIQIRGFGANEKLDVEFSPNVTTVVGKSFIGKSWLLRALKWVLCNRPTGDAFINWNSKEAKVRLSIDSKKIIRLRNSNTNSYRWSEKDHPYLALGMGNVPRDIAEFVNVSDLNFQSQHEAPFWFCETAGEVSRQLNSIVNLEVIDNTLSNISSELRKVNTEIDVREKSLLEIAQKKKGFVYVKDLDRDLKNVEKLQKLHENKVSERSRIDEKLNLVAKYTSIQEKRLRTVSDGQNVLSIGDEYKKTTNYVERLSELVESVDELQCVLDNRPASIKHLEKLSVNLTQMSIDCGRLDYLVESAVSRKGRKCVAKERLNKWEKELKEISKGRCPLCGKNLTS